jgi:nondiscriminating aspartyl-tRNA synthetase
MTSRILIKDLKTKIGETVLIKGFLHKKREVSSKLTFVVLRDRSGLVQVVLEDTDKIASLKGLQNGSILYITGEVKADERSAIGVEIGGKVDIEINNPITEVPPIEIDKEINHSPESYDILFDNRSLNVRNPIEAGIFRVRATLIQEIRQFFINNDFVEIDTPKILAGATEGGAEVFEVNYFGEKAVLAQSPQFYKQMMVGGFERVFEIGHAYRAEPSYTTRHITELLMLDMEMGFVENFGEILTMTENMFKQVCENVWKKNEKELLALKAVKPILSDKFPIFTLTELHKMFSDATGKNTIGDDDCTPEEERWICDYAKVHLGSEAVFISEFPASDMKFYQKKLESNPDVSERVDLLFRGIELATIPIRENRYENLVDQIKGVGLDPESEGFKYYVTAFKHGLPPHGGFGFGVDRFVKQLIGLSSVKESVLFPRDVKRLTP